MLSIIQDRECVKESEASGMEPEVALISHGDGSWLLAVKQRVGTDGYVLIPSKFDIKLSSSPGADNIPHATATTLLGNI